MKKIRFIINPISGIGKQKTIGELIKKYLNKNALESEIVCTKAARHAIELSTEAAKGGVDIVVAVGGDGSVNEVGSGLVGANTAMGIIPTGSGNGLARHLNIPTDLTAAVKLLNTGKVISIDTVTVNGQCFLGVAGVGFDAHVAHEFANFGKRGFSSYIKIIFREFSGYKLRNYDLVIDGKAVKKNAFLISVANSSQFGNNATIAPEADIQDGVMELCILGKPGLFALISVIFRLFNKSVHRSSHLETIRCKEVTILNNNDRILHLDGEPKKMEPELHFKIVPSSLNILVP